ncbi:MAG TPA: hypothetical protein VH134_12905 [Candidatus Dormibacteraeota bacterium]|jgi:hypothetical protein|nr:hypothetical protein [Candidatus Dormibacteraeota bacterium]
MLQPRQGESRPSAASPAGPGVTLSVLLLGLTVIGLVAGGVLSIYDWTTPGAVRPLFLSVLGISVAAVAIPVITAAGRWARAGRR